jgi:hypothetical protein
MAKRIYTIVNHPELGIVNNTTGEIISGVADIKCETIDEFIMCFMSSIPQVVKLDGNTIRVLMWCWKFSSFNPSIPEANVITNDQAFKQKIRQEGGDMTNSTIDKAIHTLYKEGMLLRRCKGSYFLNPDYFFRGTLSNRARLQCNISFGDERES